MMTWEILILCFTDLHCRQFIVKSTCPKIDGIIKSNEALQSNLSLHLFGEGDQRKCR